MAKLKHREKCIYCGNRAGTTDHVPPKSFYPKPRPSNLITVPSCQTCNSGKEKDEEFFLATMMFSEASQTKYGRELWSQKMKRVYFRDRGVGKEIGKLMSPAEITTPHGVYGGKSFALSIEYSRLERVVKNIVRGLYYHEFDEPLAPEVNVTCNWLNTQASFDHALPHIQDIKFGKKIWPDLFEYRGDRVPNKVDGSVWAMRFFGYAMFWAVTSYEECG